MSININIQNSRDFNVNTYSVSTMSSDDLKPSTTFINDKKSLPYKNIPTDNLSLSRDIHKLLEDINKKQQRLLELSESNRIPNALTDSVPPPHVSHHVEAPIIEKPKINQSGLLPSVVETPNLNESNPLSIPPPPVIKSSTSRESINISKPEISKPAITKPEINDSTESATAKILNKLKRASSVSAYGLKPSEYSASPSDYLHTSPSAYGTTQAEKTDPNAYARFYQLYEQILAKYNIFDNIDNTLVKDLYSEFSDETAIDQKLLVKELLVNYENAKSFKFNYDDFPALKINPFVETNNRYITSYVKQEYNDIIGAQLNYITNINLPVVEHAMSYTIFDGGIKPLTGGATPTNKYLGKKKDIEIYVNIIIDNLTNVLIDPTYDKYYFYIYIDTSINDKFNPINKKLIDFCIENKNRIEIVEVTMKHFMMLDGRGHQGLLGTLFRYIPLLNPAVQNCFVADSDNYNTIFLDALLEKFFTESKNPLMVFRPLLYARNNHIRKCIPNVFAGMMAFKKKSGEIFNPIIWKNMFKFIEKLYIKIKTDGNNFSCAPFIDKNTGKNPYEYGFEEQALTNVLIASAIKYYSVSAVPLVWMAPQEVADYYMKIAKQKYSLINFDFLKLIYKKMNITISDKMINNDFFYIMSFYDNNLHLNTILEILIYYKILKSKSFQDLQMDSVQIFKSESDYKEFKRLSSVLLLFVVYPGYEINIECKEFDEIVNALIKNTPIKPETMTILNKSHLIGTFLFDFFTGMVRKQPQYSNELINRLTKSIPERLLKDLSSLKPKLKQIKSESFSGSGMISNDKKTYYKTYNTYMFYIMECIIMLNNMDKSYETFTTLKLLGTDKNSWINEIEAINFDKYTEVTYDNEQTLFKYINKIYNSMNEYRNRCKKLQRTEYPSYIFNLSMINLHNIFTDSDYTPMLHNIIQYLIKSRDVLKNVSHDVYLINGDMSLDIFVDKSTDKILLHDWNAGRDEAYELELATFLVNIYFHCKYQKLVKFNVKFSKLNKFILDTFDFSSINFDLFKFYLVYVLARGGKIITCSNICENADNINDVLDELANLVITDEVKIAETMEETSRTSQFLLRNRASQYGVIENDKVDISKANIFKTNNSSYGSSYGSSYNKYLKYKEKYLKLKRNL